MIPCSQTVTEPSATPAQAIPASASAKIGATAISAKPAPMIAQPPIIVARSRVTASLRPRNEPAIAPPPQQAARNP